MEGFDREIEGFIQWCSDHFLEVNAKKTKDMVIDFSKSKVIVPPSNINGEEIERVTTYKYLGVEIDSQLKFNDLAMSKYRKLQQRLFFLRRLSYFRIDRRILQMFYKTVLQSVLTFGLLCTFGNMRAQDQAKLQRMIKTASKIIGIDQVSAARLYKELI